MTIFQQHLLRNSQVIVAAFLFGVISFTVVAAVVGPLHAPPPGTPPATAATVSTPLGQFDPFLLALFAMIAAQLPVFFAIHSFFNRTATQAVTRHADDPEVRDATLSRIWMSSTICRAALGEGAGLFGAVILLLRGEQLALVGVAFAAIVLLGVFPTRGRLETFIERAVRRGAEHPGNLTR